MRQHPPRDQREYEKRFKANMRVTGYGVLGVTQHYPCPFCAAAEWYVVRLIDHNQTSPDLTCAECGRTARFEYWAEPSGVMMKLVQVGGPDPPEFLFPAPERGEPRA